MNVNTTSTKSNISQSQCKVVSKYFTSNRVMDESLSDFQEKRTAAIKGPKNIQKPAITKPKRKKTRQVKGQKDIRTALKGNQNEIIEYTKKFDEVCLKSGVDVKSDQLLLAIALSKSLQSEETADYNTPCSSLSSQERTNKIKTTLREYGFTVPDNKISKKTRKRHKNYKLLLATELEKKQIISDKYAQVLFNVSNFTVIERKESDCLEQNLYYKATNISYREVKNNDVFYVNNLIEKSSTIGSLLRNWSDIPGRPSSPDRGDNLTMDFSEIECSQDEIDIILSGSLKSAKSIMKDKVKTRVVSAPCFTDKTSSSQNITDHSDKNSSQNCVSNKINSQNISKNKPISKQNLDPSCSVLEMKSLSIPRITRSSSPDIFDDEASGISDNNEETKNIVYTQIIDSIIEDKNKYIDSVDLTQTDSPVTKSLKCSQNSNFTRRNSNDVMEITECVGISAFPNSYNANKSLRNCESQSSHLSQQSHISNKTKRISNDYMEITDCVANKSLMSENAPVVSNVDLTQVSDEECDPDYKDTVVNGQESNNLINKSLTSSSDNELPFIKVSKCNNESLDATIILNDEEIDSVLQLSPIKNIQLHQNNTVHKEDSNKRETNKVADEIISSQSFFDEFKHDHSDDTVEINKQHESAENEVPNEDENKIDLTQSSESSAPDSVSTVDFGVVHSGLGKKDEVSIDYDELYDDVLEKSKNETSSATNLSQQSKEIIINDDDDDENPTNSKLSSELSNQNSVVYELDDQELNYSINKSRCEVPWDNYGGISVMDNFSTLENNRNSVSDTEIETHELNSPLRKSMTDSFLPMVDIRGASTKENDSSRIGHKPPIPTPVRHTEVKEAVAKTPVSSEYIVKTDQVTPMLDYASMSTPERNRELDKYGLKPFKRKRAVQLLTHLYNQTHPLVETCSEDILSPTKKRKPNQPSPKKCMKSSKENQLVCNVENPDIFEVTKEIPDITPIDCQEDDWVFQKREKAKVHSCRVPLHIAFHNYVSCRRLLRESILRYEPVNIDDIHKGLVAIGFRYDPKDLLKFMDKKCITVKTADNNTRNNKRY